MIVWSMSRGFGIRQRQIIKCLEDAQGNTDTTRNIIDKINEHSHLIPSPQSIYNAFNRLDQREVIFTSKKHNLFLISSSLSDKQLPETYTLNKDNEDYKQYIKSRSHA